MAVNKNRPVKQALISSRVAYFNWLTSPRVLLVPITWIFFYELSIGPMHAHSELMGTPLNLFEPFILITNESRVVPLIPVFYLMLVSDCPKIGSGELFIMSRTGKLSWLFGQILFFVYAAVTYLGSLFVFSTAISVKKSFFADGWSEVTRFISTREDYSTLSIASPASMIESNLYMHSRPFAACARSFLLMVLYLMVIAGIILLFNILKHKTAGIIVSFVVVVMGLVSWANLGNAMWVFPMANSIYGWHNKSILAEKVYPVANSYIYFAVLLTVLTLLSCIAIKKSAIHASCNES